MTAERPQINQPPDEKKQETLPNQQEVVVTPEDEEEMDWIIETTRPTGKSLGV